MSDILWNKKVFTKSEVAGGEKLGSWIAWVLSHTIRLLKLLANGFCLDLLFSVQNHRQAFRGRKKAHRRSSCFENSFPYFHSAQCPPQNIYHLPLHLFFFLSSLLTPYLQQPSKNRPKGMSQTRGSSHHFIFDCLFNLGHLRENTHGGQKLGCVLGSVSGGTGKWKEIFGE